LIAAPAAAVPAPALVTVVARATSVGVPGCATLVVDGVGVLEDAEGKITASRIATARNARAAIRSSVSRVRWTVMVRLDGPPG
jgi:hypothetical protein